MDRDFFDNTDLYGFFITGCCIFHKDLRRTAFPLPVMVPSSLTAAISRI